MDIDVPEPPNQEEGDRLRTPQFEFGEIILELVQL